LPHARQPAAAHVEHSNAPQAQPVSGPVNSNGALQPWQVIAYSSFGTVSTRLGNGTSATRSAGGWTAVRSSDELAVTGALDG
jgi:hypothetical protein